MAIKFRPENTIENPSIDARQAGLGRAVWEFFSSMRTAILLLLVLAVVSIAGTVILQDAPPEAYIMRYGERTYSMLRGLGLDHVYRSSWYVLLMSLVGINLAVCSVNRFGIAWRQTFQPSIPQRPEDITSMQRHEEISGNGSVDGAADKVTLALRSYRVWTRRGDGETFLYAAKGRLGIWGPYLTHLSILLIFAGAVLGGWFGFHGYVVLTEGDRTNTCEIGDREKDLGFEVGLDRFAVEHDEAHNVTGFKSDLKVYHRGRVTASKTVDVNHPLMYKGVSFFQTNCGIDRLQLRVKSPDGESKLVSFEIGTQDMLADRVDIGGKSLVVYMPSVAQDYVGGQPMMADFPINPAVRVALNDRFPNMDAWQDLGWLTALQSAKWNGFTVTLEKVVKYSGLKVSRNPGLPVVYMGFGLILVGVVGSFYVTRKVIKIRIAPCKGGVTVLAGASSRADPSVFDRDFERLRGVIDR